ncbi:hypothetical protein KDL45_10360 [bacterium]|nr:hypothetical protein [bacterium]MCB9476607.1 hypothetical protein [Deltaproteobacteria bacterium]
MTASDPNAPMPPMAGGTQWPGGPPLVGYVLAAVGGFFFAALIFGAFGGNPFRLPPSGDGSLTLYAPNRMPLPTTQDEIEQTERCAVACDHVVECGMVPSMDLCLPWCLDDWSKSEAECAAETPCDLIETVCFGETDEQVCERVCEHTEDCVWRVGMGDDACREECVQRWSVEQRECLLSADCIDGYQECLAFQDDVPCANVCQKLTACEWIGEDEADLCAAMCEDELDPRQRDCIMAQECDETEAVCLAGLLPEPMCADACETAALCDMLTVPAIDCPTVCETEWDEELAVCLANVSDCDGAAQCLSLERVQCAELCVRVVECGYVPLEEYAGCEAGCPTDFTVDERECMLAADCEGMDACLIAEDEVSSAERRQECRVACSRLAACGEVTTAELIDCVDECEEAWTTVRVNCVNEAGSCDAIVETCMGEAPTPETAP